MKKCLLDQAARSSSLHYLFNPVHAAKEALAEAPTFQIQGAALASSVAFAGLKS
jgi:hypothetical protein